MRVWSILVKAAAARRTLTYGALADELGGRNAGYVPRFMSGRFLNPIKDYCDSRGLPRLRACDGITLTASAGDGMLRR